MVIQVSEPTGTPDPLGYEVAYEMLFATMRAVERKLQEAIGVLDEATRELRVAYEAAEHTRGSAFTRK